MTSPKVLEPEEKSWTLGVVTTPAGDMGVYNVQPIVGYRTGLGNNREFGATIYGVYFPGFVVNLKKNYFKNGNRYLTGDVSAFGGIARPLGTQYDLLYGTADFYGSVGVGVGMYEDVQMWGNVSLGYEFGEKDRYGFQVAYSFGQLAEMDRNIISVGLKMDLIGIKKKFRK